MTKFFLLAVFAVLLMGCRNLPATDRGPRADGQTTGSQERPEEGAGERKFGEAAPSEDGEPKTEAAAVRDEAEQKSPDTQKADTQKKRPPTYSIEAIKRRIRKLILPPVYLVTVEGEFRAHVKDLNSDGVPEILVPCIETREKIEPDSVSDFSSLFKRDRKPYRFYLYIFQIVDSGPVFFKRLVLGPRYVFGGIAGIQINRTRPFPSVIVVKFQTQEGEEQEWLIFNGKSMLPISRLSLTETFSSKLLVEDIDGDGNLDIIVEEKGSEEGIGMETFLTWYRWNGWSFGEYATANVVRSLRKFLTEIRDYILKKDWRNLVSLSFLSEDVQRERNRKRTLAEVILRAFRLTEYYDTSDRPASDILGGLEDIVFPEFMENPFLAKDERGSFFRLVFRVVDSQGVSIVSETLLYRMRNPFGKRQFFIKID